MLNFEQLSKIVAKSNAGFVFPNGQTVIRILPGFKGQLPLTKVGYHKIGGQIIYCPRILLNQQCPICEHTSVLSVK